uniref:Uncharacterized protein n=1 Tax=Siphoviridae sp. ctBCr48 TaxID=2827802 RepID=A0A8S5SHK9_9CAUD|nr:MAG TPA: hypothetical protein [Siphoviridae sp. ctBCr48]
MNNSKEAQVLEKIHDKLFQITRGIYTTIDNHLGDDDTNVDIIFLKQLYAEAKGLLEADKIVCDKLKELTKEDNND